MKDNQITGGILGVAIGDALGVPVEFSRRSERGMDPISCGGNGERSNGNGSLMRILPAAFYVFNLPHKTRKKITALQLPFL